VFAYYLLQVRLVPKIKLLGIVIVVVLSVSLYASPVALPTVFKHYGFYCIHVCSLPRSTFESVTMSKSFCY